jgi:hypothetical protein
VPVLSVERAREKVNLAPEDIIKLVSRYRVLET